MKYVLVTNDNFFSFVVMKRFLQLHKNDIKLVVFSSKLIGQRGSLASIYWSIINTGFRRTFFKLSVYGVFRAMSIIRKVLPFIPNNWSSEVWVKENGIEFTTTEELNSDSLYEVIKSKDPDLIISVSMNQIMKERLLTLAPMGSINVHCAPLPKYAGMSPYVWALANNEAQSAATIHFMTEGLDEGDIILQEDVLVKSNDTAFNLFYRCCLAASDQLVRVVSRFEKDTVESFEQDKAMRSYYSWPDRECSKRLRANGFKFVKASDYFKALIHPKH